ncbi:MAG: hypothetical protein ACJ8AW_01045 [Rhodopila sp.]
MNTYLDARAVQTAAGRAMAEAAVAGVATVDQMLVLARLAGALRGGATLGQAASSAKVSLWTATGVMGVVARERWGGR